MESPLKKKIQKKKKKGSVLQGSQYCTRCYFSLVIGMKYFDTGLYRCTVSGLLLIIIIIIFLEPIHFMLFRTYRIC